MCIAAVQRVTGNEVQRMRQGEFLRIVKLFAGLTAYSVGIVLTVQASMGLSPWDAFHQGVSLHCGITFGMASIVVSAILVAINILCREPLGLGTVLNIFYIGIVIDALMLHGVIKEAQGLLPGIVMMICGLFVIAAAMVLYMAAGYGSGPRDALMTILAKHTGKPAGVCRGAVEGIVLAAGWLLGGSIGIGTVISVLFIGVAVQVVFSAARFDIRTIRHESAGETINKIRASLS